MTDDQSIVQSATNTGEPIDCVIIHQHQAGGDLDHPSYPGVVKSYDSSMHIGLMTQAEALNHAKCLAISNPGVTYIIARIMQSVCITPDNYDKLRSQTEGNTTGRLYAAVGADSNVRARRYLP